MLQTVKSNFLLLIIFAMSSAVFAADKNADTKQPETIIHKAGIQVKSTRIYDNVPSRQYMDTQGKSIEEIKGPDMSTGDPLYRGEPISNWTTEDYINVTPQKFHKALRNQTVPSNKSYRPKLTVVPGDESSVEQRTAPISTWGVQDYLKVMPQSKHRAINEMQKAPIVTPGEVTDVAPRTRPISEFSKEDYLKIAPPSLHDAINNQGGTFTVGNSRSYDEITIIISTDYWYGESSWNLYDSTAGAFYYTNADSSANNQTFTSAYETQTVTLELQPGDYAVVAYDSYGDGGMSGTVTDENGIVLTTILLSGASGTYGFTVSPPTYDVTINLSIDYWASEGSWQLFDGASAAVTTLQTFSTGYETQTMTLALEGGSYTLMTYDSYGDGGITGTVSDADGNTLATVNHTTGTSQSWTFAIGLYDVTVTLQADYWASESSWNLYGPYNDTTASAYYYSSNQTFSTGYEIQTTVFSLAAGDYSVDVWDAYGDGGVSGAVTDADGTILVNVTSSYGSFGAFIFEVVVPEPVLADLFFSEYIEGSSNNKALELYNPTEDTLELDDYMIYTNYNGNDFDFSDDHIYTFPAGATLAPGDVFVAAHSSAVEEVLQAADSAYAYGTGAFITSYNGDDVRALAKIKDGDTLFIDVVGDYDFDADSSFDDPGSGFDVAGVNNATANHTLIRKPHITMGNLDWTESAGTHADTSEWIVHAQNYFANIGGHPDDPCWGISATFAFTTGSYAGEVQYYVTDEAGDTLTSCIGCMGSNNTTYTTEGLCLADGDYIVWGKDSYGDTWNGGSYEITDAEGVVITSGTGPEYEGSGNSVWHAYPFAIGKGVAKLTGADFDGLVLNDSETAAVIVKNGGYGEGANLMVDSASVTNSAFSVSSAVLPDTLAAGETLELQVTFTPTEETDYSAYVVVHHSDTLSSPDSVMVSGFGIDAYFYEGFGPYTGSYTELPMDDWTIVDGNADADSIPQRYKTWYHDNYSTSGGNMTVYNGYSNSYWADETMITPLIHTLDLAKLSFKTYDYYEYLDVDYSVDGTNFMELASVYLSGAWQQHDITLPDVDSLWVSITYAPDSGYSTTTYLNLDEVKVVPLPNTYMEGWVYDQDSDLGVGGVSVMLNSIEVTTTGENTLFLDSGFEDSSFVGSYLTTTSGWWVYPPELTNFYHTIDGDSIYNDTLQANGSNMVSVFEGDRALKMWGQYTGAENYTSIYQEMGAVDEGQEMYVGAWAMTAADNKLAGGTAFYVAINWFAADHVWLGQDQSEWMDTSYAVDEWHYVDVNGVAPAGVANVQLQLTYYQPVGYDGGSVYVDKTRATMTPGSYSYRGMDEGDYTVSFQNDDYNPATFSNVGIADDVADTTWLNAGLAPMNLTDWWTGFEAAGDSGSTVIESGTAAFTVMDSLRLTVTDSTVYTDTTSTGADTTWTVYDTTNYNIDPYMGNSMLVFPDRGGVYEDSAYAMWIAGESFDITDYLNEGGYLSMNYYYNIDVELNNDYFYVGVMLDDSTVWWGDYNKHTGTTSGGWYYGSADLTWLRALDEDSSTTATPIIIFESDDTLTVGWGGAFDDFNVDGNPWFLPAPGHIHAESFDTHVPLYWEEPMSSGRVTYELRSFHLNDMGNLQRPVVQTENGVQLTRGPREYETQTISSYFDNSATQRDVVSYSLFKRAWDSSTGLIGDWGPLVVTTGNSYFDFDVSLNDRYDYYHTVRFEDGDNGIQSNHAHARVGVPYVMLVDSFATTATFDSTFGEHWEIWSSSEYSSWVIGDSSDATGSTGATSEGSYKIPAHPDSAGTFAYVSDGRNAGHGAFDTWLMTPYLDFSHMEGGEHEGHRSGVVSFDGFAQVYADWNVSYGLAKLYVKVQSEDLHEVVNVKYDHNAGWDWEAIDVADIVGYQDRVQFLFYYSYTGNNSSGNGMAIDDFTVETLDGPTNLTAAPTTESVVLHWEGLDGRRANQYPDFLTAEDKENAHRAIQPIGTKVITDGASFSRTTITSDDDTRPVITTSRTLGDNMSEPFEITFHAETDTILMGTTDTLAGFTHDYDDPGPSYPTSTAPDVVYKITLVDSVNGLIFDFCESYYDTRIYLYAETDLAAGDTTTIAWNDDYCTASHGQPWTSYMEVGNQLLGGLSVGTYWLVVDGYSASSMGEYVGAISVMVPPPALMYNVWKDGNHIAFDLPDSVLTYTDNNVSLLESAYWVTASLLMELSNVGSAGLTVDYASSDNSNDVWAAKENTPPGAFALVTPPDGQELVITVDNISGNQIFAWSQSVDPNGSVITYHATLQVPAGTDTLEISVDTTGTAVLVPYASIAQVMTAYATATGNYTADVSWTVYADDGWDEIEASNGPRSISVDIGWYLGMNDEAIIPDVFALHQNYPNPFNPVTTIRYDIPEQALVRIDVYNILGQKVAVLAEGLHEPGFHAVRWNGTNMYGNALSSGMYFYHIKAGDFRDVKKLLLVK